MLSEDSAGSACRIAALEDSPGSVWRIFPHEIDQTLSDQSISKEILQSVAAEFGYSQTDQAPSDQFPFRKIFIFWVRFRGMGGFVSQWLANLETFKEAPHILQISA